MSSTNKTSLGLNQWVGTDTPKREDFNEDNRIIDAALVGEHGSWTPTVGGVTTIGTGHAYTTQNGIYSRIGNQVIANCTISGTWGSGMSGRLAIFGLPFIVGSRHGIGSFISTSGAFPISWTGMMTPIAYPGSTYIYFYNTIPQVAGREMSAAIVPNATGSSFNYYITVTYISA